MSYIIIWRNTHINPFVEHGSNGFLISYDSYELAKNSAEEMIQIENENGESPWFFDYQIYKEVDN